MVARPLPAIADDPRSPWFGQSSGNWREDSLQPAQPTTDSCAPLQQYRAGMPQRLTVSSARAFTTAWQSPSLFEVTTSPAVSRGRPVAELGWSPEEALETRMRLRTFAEDWDAPGMNAYDDL